MNPKLTTDNDFYQSCPSCQKRVLETRAIFKKIEGGSVKIMGWVCRDCKKEHDEKMGYE